IVNVVLATKQELGAEKALDALKSMHSHMTVVIRDGEKMTLDAEKLVPGDIISVETGDMIPADSRIIEGASLRVDESILTGESVPVEKDSEAIVPDKAPLGDRTNMLFSGCLITGGRALAIVVATGMSTQMGKIAGLLSDTKKVKTPLQRKMDRLGRVLCIVAIVAGAIMLLMEILKGSFSENPMLVMLNAVSMAVAVVPECLPIIVTATLAYGVMLMAEKNAIIRKLSAVETLGSTSVICSDKTGTLTMNKMTIKRIWAVGHEPADATGKLNRDEMRLIEMMGLASNASIVMQDGVEKAIGDPTETAIIRLLKDKKIEKDSLCSIFPRVFEIPFDSARKLMTTVHETDDLEELHYISITKGAFDRIPIGESAYIDDAKRIHDEFADRALRVLAVAYKHYDSLPENMDADELENSLVFAGFVGMIDPPRPESQAAVQTAREAGIRTIMITGDHAATASAIAREIGILGDDDKALTGVELESMTDEVLVETVKDYSVYARVSPEDKIRIVKAWQRYNEVVAMTGDGVNDAPALKAADAGVAMGSGTDVSKSASDVVLTDDNFSSIVDAVKEGRRVYTNIRKVLCSLVACNLSEIFTMLLGLLFWNKAPLVAIQLLFINVVADGVPDLCMCYEPAEIDAMNQKPVKHDESIFARGVATRILLYGTVFAIVSLVAYYIGAFYKIGAGFAPSHEIGMTMAYLVIGWSSVFNIFNVRSFNQSIFKIGFTSNRLLFYGICFSLVALGLTAVIPGLREVFYCVPVSFNHWLIMLPLSISPLIAGEIHKVFVRKKQLRLAVSV
ncbi:MAG: cation-translocating P-type ATPase, partial [Oscillospiraceae bacterium]|nr:cation-translocating P-type ATPase [Oscillospiraceae bacterium]